MIQQRNQKQIDNHKKEKRQNKNKNKKHLQIFLRNKQNLYFDKAINEWNKVKYYEKIDMLNVTYEQLHQLLSNTFVHARRRQNFFTIVDRHPDLTLRCIYSGQILSDSQGNFLQKCDQQHSFPQSFQRGSKAGTGRDMHAIFSASKHANGSRGNIPFGNFGKCIEVDKYGKLYKQGNIKTYQPILNSGAVARAHLYILTCYKNCANENYLPKKCLQWLVKNACETEITQWQLHRNQQLFKLQGNRNPYIDYPKLAKNINFQQGWQKNQ